MLIVVCVKQVLDPEMPRSAFKIDPQQKRVVPPRGTPPVLSPFDENALEAALRIKDQHGAKVIAISMGSTLAQPVLRKTLAAGADELIHTQIAAMSGNPIFVAVSEAMLGWLKAYHTDLLLWSGKENFTLAEHAEIVDAIESHDADGAEAAMVRHLQRSSGLYGLRG